MDRSARNLERPLTCTNKIFAACTKQNARALSKLTLAFLVLHAAATAEVCMGEDGPPGETNRKTAIKDHTCKHNPGQHMTAGEHTHVTGIIWC